MVLAGSDGVTTITCFSITAIATGVKVFSGSKSSLYNSGAMPNVLTAATISNV